MGFWFELSRMLARWHRTRRPADEPLFPLGRVRVSPGAAAVDVSPAHVVECLARHARGDHGLVSQEDRIVNAYAMRDGGRVLSSYPISPDIPSDGHGSNTLWIMTDGSREHTTVLLPEEYD